MQVDETGQVRGFIEKPQTEEEIAKVRMEPSWIDARGIPSQGRDLLSSMGLYIFDKDLMVDLLENSLHSDFGKEVFPEAINTHKVQLHLFDGYWEDIGTIRSFYEANLSLASKNPPFDIRNRHSPIYSRPRFLPPTIMGNATIRESLIADGCFIGDNVTIENSVIGLRTVIGDNVTIKNSVVMGADFIEMRGSARDGNLPLGIGAGSYITGAILDKNCRIGKNVRITNAAGLDHQGEDEPLQIRDGISIVIKEGQINDGHQS
jgi:glucose-1-phosphate adenylyltransferase